VLEELEYSLKRNYYSPSSSVSSILVVRTFLRQ